MKVTGRTEWVDDELFEKRAKWNRELQVKSADGIIKLWDDHGEEFSNVNVSTALVSLSKVKSALDEPVICEMVGHYVATPNAVKVRNAASIIRALSQMQFKSQGANAARVAVFNLVKQRVVTDRTFFDEVTSVAIVWLLHGFAIPAAKGDVVFTAAESVVKAQIEACEGWEVIEFAAAYSKKNCRNEAILALIEQRVLNDSSHYKIAELAHVAFSFSTLGFGSERFYQTVYCEIVEQVERLDGKGILYCLDAFRARTQNQDLAHILAREICAQANSLSCKDLSLILNAFTKTKYPDDRFYEHMERVVLDLLPRCNFQDLATFAAAFSRAHAGSGFFYGKLKGAVTKIIDRFSPSMLALVYHSFAVSSMVNNEFFTAIENRLANCRLESKDVVIMLWSMLLSGRKEQKTLRHFIGCLNKICDGGALATTKENRNKLIECSAILRKEWPELYAALSKNVFLEIERARHDRSMEVPDRSPFQQEVETALTRCGVVFEAEYRLEGFPVDIFVPERNLVVEVNGRPHYYRANPEKLNATSVMKKRILEAAGYKVFMIAYFDWPYSKEIALQDQFIKKLLRLKR